METNLFGFRIINLSDGTQIIDTRLKTPHDSLTALQMEEYIEVDVQLDYMDRMKRKEQREEERRNKLARNPFYRVACLFGIA